jgi:hypothetical protein
MNLVNRAAAATLLASSLVFLSSCTGGQESAAGTVAQPQKTDTQQPTPSIDAAKELQAMSAAIPVYEGAQFRNDLTQRDAVDVRNRFGRDAKVYTLGTDDSYPQVYHYYVIYLAQFRNFDPPSPYPPENQNWRTMQVDLSQAMQDPFIPGDALNLSGKKVTLEIAETEAQPRTVIRYIVSPSNDAAAPAQVAAVVHGQRAAAAPAAVSAAPGLGEAGAEAQD